MNTKLIGAMVKACVAGSALVLGLGGGRALADTTISNGVTFTIDSSNTTSNGTIRVWNDTGTLTMFNGSTLQVLPPQKPSTNIIGAPAVFTGAAGTITMKFNHNDIDFLITNSVNSTASAAQTLAIYAGLGGAPGGDRLSVTFNTGIPDGNGLSLTVYFNSQSGNNSWVNLKGTNTFTGPINLVKAGALLNGYLTIGGQLTRYNGNTFGSGSLNNGNYAGAIALGTSTIFNYASTAPQTLAGPISGVGAVQVTGSGAVTLSGTNTYTGNTTVSSGCSLILATNGMMKFAVNDSSNNVVTGAGSATFNGTFTLDTSGVTLNSNSWTLVNVTTKTYGANFGLTGFTGPVGNIYTSSSGGRVWTFNKTTGVLTALRPALITSFGIPGYAGVINQTNKTISMTIPAGISLATLAPTFTLSSGTCNQTSGAPPSPTFAVQNPATYSVVDGTTTNNYLVTVMVTDLSAWSKSASFYVLTTTNGAKLPASASETNFPILLRLNASNFNFSQAQTNGADIRFTTAATNILPYEIEQWDSVNGTASIWVLVPSIRGNTNQQLRMFWGNTNATSESSGPAVFNAANGYSCVLHLNGVTDSVGVLTPVNAGTSATNGVTGPARSFTVGKGINCGTSITTLPAGDTPHTTEAWFRASASGNTLVAHGVAQGAGKVVMQLVSPPRINVDCWFSAGNVSSVTTLSLSQWYHVAHVYSNLQARIYVNGVLDGSASSGTPMAIPTTQSMYVGGWNQVNGTYDFAGEIDEVRISSMARSSNWMWMQYQSQNPMQTLVGHLVQPGSTFSVSTTNVTMNEGRTTNLTAQAGGAVKVYWLLKQSNQSTVIAVDQFACALTAGRVTGNQSYVIQFKAAYLDGSVQTNDIAVNVLDTIPDPVFTLAASTNLWDGRQTMTVTPVISNWAALQAAGATNLTYNWNLAGVAVIKTNPAPGTLTLLRSQGSGPMTVTLVLNNGGTPATNFVTVPVQEPASDAWVVRVPSATEKATNNQFYARDDTGYGTVHYNGTIGGSPDSVFLKVFVNGVLYANVSATPSGGAYALSARIAAGLVTYSLQFGTVTGGVTNVLDTVSNLVCGDAYLVDGQSNAVTSDVPDDFSTNQWVRSYGKSGAGWGYGVPHGGNWHLGYWGWALATNIVASHGIPVCILNGAVGGTRIDQHMANPTNHFSPYGPFGYTIYADLLTRVVGAKLTHGIRGFLWHQGEQDQGAVGVDGDYNYKFYQQYFVDMSAAWKQDCPNLRYYYIYQIWPAACGDTSANDMLREVQRTLPRLYSNMRVMSTLGIVPGGSCHYSVAGYLQFFNLMGPLVRQDNYGYVPTNDITAPDLQQAYFTTTNRNEIALVFGQNVAWNSSSAGQFYFDYASPASPGVTGKVASGSAIGNVIKLQLTGPSTNKTITYVVGGTWGSAQSNLLRGNNGIAALTFCSVPIADPVVPVATPPVLKSLLPTSGRTNGGTVVTLSGSNFLAGATVQFGANNATGVSVTSPTQITATTPANSPGAVDVLVLNTNGLAVTNVNAFTYVLPPPPATLSSAGQAGGNLVMVWSGGTNQSCVLLSSTNVTQPLSTWTPVATNAVGPGGLSTNSVPIGAGEPERYYLLSIPYL